MIAWLSGKIVARTNSALIIVSGGVGYRVRVSAYTFGKLAGAVTAELFVHTHVREQEISLYGFLSQEELEMFELLLSVSGIGPKAALGILAIADPHTIRTAIAHKDTSILTKVSGVGKRTAERLVIELQNKVGAAHDADTASVSADSDAIDALLSMGYSVSEARAALQTVNKDVTDVGEKVRLALRSLGKK